MGCLRGMRMVWHASPGGTRGRAEHEPGCRLGFGPGPRSESE
jgi:hypothetical protein